MEDPYRKTPALVFGAAGFIGRWVASGLNRQEATCYLVVRDRSAAERAFSAFGVTGEVVVADLQQCEQVESLIEKIAPDVTFNLAGYGVDPSERDAEVAYRINAHHVSAICQALAKRRDSKWSGPRVVHAGSALEYGDIGGSLSEDSRVNPTTLYGKSKLLGTELLSQSCRRLGLAGVTARLFTVYGPGEHESRLLPSLLESARTGRHLPMTSGVQKRDFTYVGDVAEGLLRLGVSGAKPGEVVNLATGLLTSVRNFVETGAGILNIHRGALEFGAIPSRPEEMQHDAVAIDRLRQLTAWAPLTNIPEGIRRTEAFEEVAGMVLNREKRRHSCLKPAVSW